LPRRSAIPTWGQPDEPAEVPRHVRLIGEAGRRGRGCDVLAANELALDTIDPTSS
jgi:hypothetical protein